MCGVATNLGLRIKGMVDQHRGKMEGGREGGEGGGKHATHLSDEEPGKEVRGEVEETHHVHVLCQSTYGG